MFKHGLQIGLLLFGMFFGAGNQKYDSYDRTLRPNRRDREVAECFQKLNRSPNEENYSGNYRCRGLPA